ncbi:cyclophilin-like fold protein [Aerococcus sp. 1KP-2016]|uniref:cyclophilin-like fold protein n=1 Tax=Aerococcus sp. 1KP-2016 TaxID=1981982 RepID=UPI000B995543|nr:cyclophilin-like fold protein [Aerococcus sp. 1KP-2016]OYQ67960.1 hypothetical protein B9P78_01640 [Aerococcus sp. 1KP-2016]
MFDVLLETTDRTYEAVFYENELTEILVDAMPFTIDLRDFMGQEKVGSIPIKLPSLKAQQVGTVEKGHLYLWANTDLVLFYKTFDTTYSYVNIGYFKNAKEVDALVSATEITVILRKNFNLNR